MSWKHQSRAVCVLGACCKDSAWFSRRWEALRFLRLLRRHSMQREKRWNTLLRKSFRLRNDAIKSLCSSVRRFRDATIKQECKGDYPHALQALWKALDRAGDLIQS